MNPGVPLAGKSADAASRGCAPGTIRETRLRDGDAEVPV